MNKDSNLIMVVDDDQGILESFEAIFGDEHPVLLVDNGLAAKKVLREQKPRLMFLDLKMPGMSGFDVLEWMQRNGVHTSVVVITALPQDDTEALARSYGVNGYIRKPFDLEEVESLAAWSLH